MTLIKVPTNTDIGMAAPVRRTCRVGNFNHHQTIYSNQIFCTQVLYFIARIYIDMVKYSEILVKESRKF